jgi:hypothetical protein
MFRFPFSLFFPFFSSSLTFFFLLAFSTAAQKKQFAALLSSGAQLCLVTGTLARAKSFLGELYRPGESSSSSGASSLGTSPGLSDDHRPVLENSSSEGSIHSSRRGGSRATQHRNSASAAVQVRQRSLDSPIEDPDYDNSKAHHVIVAAAASLTDSHSSSPVPFVGSRKALLECVAALLARSGGDQLIGALCNDVFKELHATLTDLAQSDRAKEFFASHADVFEVYGPLTQKRVRLVGSVDPQLIAAGERYLAAHGSSIVDAAHPAQLAALVADLGLDHVLVAAHRLVVVGRRLVALCQAHQRGRGWRLSDASGRRRRRPRRSPASASAPAAAAAAASPTSSASTAAAAISAAAGQCSA